MNLLFGLSLLGLFYFIFLSPQNPVMSPPPAHYFSAVKEDRWAFITGGTSGIGFQFAADLLERGFSVIITGTKQSSLDSAIAKLSPSSKVKGVVIDTFDYKDVISKLERAFNEHNIAVVIFHANPEVFIPVHLITAQWIEIALNSYTTSLVQAVAVSTKFWLKNSKPGVFLGTSSLSANFDIYGGELYSASRVFQTNFLKRQAKFLLRNGNEKFFKSRTEKNILVAVSEIPIVDTPTLDKAKKDEPELVQLLTLAQWDSKLYAKMVLSRVLDHGQSLVVEGPLWKFVRFVANFAAIPFDFSENNLCKRCLDESMSKFLDMSA